MTFDSFPPDGLLLHAGAFVLPFALCFALARAGHARTAWWVPGGILLLTTAFLALGFWLGSEVQTGPHAMLGLLVMTVPAVVGGAAGILTGRRRA